MNLAGLSQTFEANKGPILATAGAAVAGFALYQRRKGSAPAAAPVQGVTTAPALSAGGQSAAMTGGAYDSSSSDVYGLLQPQLESLGGQLSDLQGRMGAVPVSSAPPVASTLFAPTYSGNYVRYSDGWFGERENDGSLLWFTPAEAQQATARNGGKEPAFDQLTTPVPVGVPYSVQGNLAKANTTLGANAGTTGK